MSRPRFSIIVPTRNRATTLGACLRTVLEQEYDDYEVIVADNASSPETRELVESLASERVRYLRSDEPLAMSANWERAVAAAQGEYLHVLGDDDGLMPYALKELARLVDEHDRPRAIQWQRAVWTWPTIAVEGEGHVLRLPMSSQLQWREARAAVREVVGLRKGADWLPMIYSAVVHRDLVDEQRERNGAVFCTIYPDTYSGFAFGWLAGRWLCVDTPMSVAGLGGRSNGVATLAKDEGDPIAEEFNSLNRAFGYLPHPRVPDLQIARVHVIDSFEYAREQFFPDDEELTYDRWELTKLYLAGIPELPEHDRKRYVETIRASLADRPDLQPLVDDEAAQHPPAGRLRFRPAHFGFDGTRLHLDTAGWGVEDVADLAAFAARLRGYDGSPLQYRVRSGEWWQDRSTALGARAERAEARAAAAEQEVADLTRRVRRLRRVKQELTDQLEQQAARPSARLRRVAGRITRPVRTRVRARRRGGEG